MTALQRPECCAQRLLGGHLRHLPPHPFHAAFKRRNCAGCCTKFSRNKTWASRPLRCTGSRLADNVAADDDDEVEMEVVAANLTEPKPLQSLPKMGKLNQYLWASQSVHWKVGRLAYCVVCSVMREEGGWRAIKAVVEWCEVKWCWLAGRLAVEQALALTHWNTFRKCR